MARRFAKVSGEETKEAFFIYLRVSVDIHHYSPPLRGIVVYYFRKRSSKAVSLLVSVGFPATYILFFTCTALLSNIVAS